MRGLETYEMVDEMVDEMRYEMMND